MHFTGPGITEYLGWNKTSGDHLVQSCLAEQGQLEEVVQDCLQVCFEHLQGWRLHCLSGQHVPVFADHYCKFPFYSVQVKFPVSHFVAIAFCPIIAHP